MAWLAGYSAPVGGSALERIMGVPNLVGLFAGPQEYVDLYDYYEDFEYGRQSGKSVGIKFADNYYDRPFGYLGAWWRTGNQVYYDRALETANWSYDEYWNPNNFNVPPREYFPEGAAALYLLENDPKWLAVVEGFAQDAWFWIDGGEDILNTNYRDGRIQGRSVLSNILAYELTGNATYKAKADYGISAFLQWFDAGDAVGHAGAWGSGLLPGAVTNQYGNGMGSFQICHALLYAMVRYHELIAPIPRLNEVLTATLDRTWLFWEDADPDPKNNGLRYAQPPYDFIDANGYDAAWSYDLGSNNPAKDLSIFCATAYAYGYYYTGLPRFKTYGDALWAHGLSGTVSDPTIYLSDTTAGSSKQFNQTFFRSWRYHYLTGE